MTISQMEAEAQPREDNDQTFLVDAPDKLVSSQNKRNPPARNTSRFWFERFLSVIQRQNPSVIDASFLSQIAPSNEGKLLAQLKFLHVVDDKGKPTPVLQMLNMVGEEQRKAFKEIAQESYKELFGEVKIDKALPDDLVNFFIRKYAFSRDKAINAAKFFLYLAEKGGIHVSEELTVFLSEKAVSSQSQNGGNQLSATKIIERSAVRSIQRETKAPSNSLQTRQLSQRRKGSNELPSPQGERMIQAVISIKLDKDTPREYWDRVLALLGEKKGNAEVIIETADGNTNDDTDTRYPEIVNQELSGDSNFT